MSLQTGFSLLRQTKDALNFTETNAFSDSLPASGSSGPNATISWSSVSGGSTYVALLGSATQNYSTSIATTGLSMKFTGLSQGGLYFAAVYALDASSHTGYLSNEVNFRIPKSGQEKYVTTTGSSNAAGTLADPWSFQKSLNSASPGDTIYLRGGSYFGNFSATTSGSANNVITWRNYPNETAILVGNTVLGASLTLRAQKYTRIQGFYMTTNASGAYGLYSIGEGSHLEIDSNNCYSMVGGGSSGMWIEGPLSTAANSFLTNNVCHDTDSGGITFWNFSGGYWRIEGNEVYNCGTASNYDALQVGSGGGAGHHMLIRRNYSHDNNVPNTTGGDQLDIGGHFLAHHYLSEENFIDVGVGHGNYKLHCGGYDAVWSTGISGHCISRFNIVKGTNYLSYGYPNTTSHYNNTFYDGGEFVEWYTNNVTSNSEGDATYTVWTGITGKSDTDTGRMNFKNNLCIQMSTSSSYSLNTNENKPTGIIIDESYSSIRMQNNYYKFSTNQRLSYGTFFTTAADSNFASYLTSNSPWLPDTGSTKYAIGTAVTSIFKDQPNNDFQPASGAAHIGKAKTLTSAIGSGTASTTLTVDRASYFYDGYPSSSGELVGYPDTIQIGSASPVQIASIAESSSPGTFNVITLAAPRTWSDGDGVRLYNKGNDMGALDSLSGTTRPVMPKNVVVTSISLT